MDKTRSAPAPVFGISNSGSTCWLATLIQFLLSSRALVDAVRASSATDVIAREFRQMVDLRDGYGYAFTSQFISAVSNHDLGSSQKSMLDALHILAGAFPELYDALLMRTRAIIRCSCGYISENKYEHLFVPADGRRPLEDEILARAVTTDYKCTCGKLTEIRERATRLGDIIIVVINKQPLDLLANKQLEFPGLSGKITYELAARCEHSGTNSGGHYYAYGMRGDQPRPYILNDSSTREITTDEFYTCSKNTYALLYSKK